MLQLPFRRHWLLASSALGAATVIACGPFFPENALEQPRGILVTLFVNWLVKPFSMKELTARVAAAARRGTRAQDPRRGDEIVIEELRLDTKNVQAYVDGRSAELTPTEFRLLYALALEQGRVLTRDELLQRLWGRRETHRDRTVDVFVKKLREKLDRPGAKHTFIQTRYGVGYKLEAEPKS